LEIGGASIALAAGESHLSHLGLTAIMTDHFGEMIREVPLLYANFEISVKSRRVGEDPQTSSRRSRLLSRMWHNRRIVSLTLLLEVSLTSKWLSSDTEKKRQIVRCLQNLP